VSTIRPTLCIVPAYLRTAEELDVLLKCLVSLQATAPDANVLVVDDCSPAPELAASLELACDELGIAFVANEENSGFSRTVNVGLELAHAMEHDAVLVNADIEFPEAGWLDRMRARTDTEGRPAAVVGARLLYPNGLLQHAGVSFSLLGRDWLHRYRFGPANLPEALVPCRCIVTGALQLIRWETLEAIGLYDEGYRLCFEDVDYCLRVFQSGLECIYEPSVMAVHHESYFRGNNPTPQIKRWTTESTARMWRLWGHEDLSRWVPEYL
jgi:GT2 family glycosyltransferase